MRKVLIAYVPVLHEGYRRFFEKYKDFELHILGSDIIGEFARLSKEIRQLDPELVKKTIKNWGIFSNVSVIGERDLKNMVRENLEIVMPREDVCEDLSEKYFSGKKVLFDNVFLRWDKHRTVKEFPVNPDAKISREEVDKKFMLEAHTLSKKSSDWWRRIGSAIIKDGEIIISACNKHVPSEHMPFVNGDPRSNFHKGMRFELSTAIHSEAACIAEAAKKGISLEGTSIYATTFPCPPCAKLIAYSGIKKLFYNIGYGVLDGESILKSRGVEIIFVDIDLPREKEFGAIEYKK